MNKYLQYANCLVALTLQKPKEVGFLVLMLLFVMMAVQKSIPPSVDKVFELHIHKNRVAINKVSQERDITASKTQWVDKLMLKDGANIVHPKLGAIGFGDSFFIDVESEFEVKEPGIYYFIPGSDDGFSLTVNGVKLCAYEGDRPYATMRCRVELEKGEHTFKMSYFQGGGHSGLTLAYQKQGDSKKRWVGENSRYIKFD